MELINHLVSWKKNIKRIPLTGYSFSFDNLVTNLEKIKTELLELGLKSNNSELINICKNNLLIYSKNNTVEKYSFETEPDYNVLGKSFEIKLWYDFLNNNLSGRITFEKQINNFAKELINIYGIGIMIEFNPHYKAWENLNSPKYYKYKRGLKVYFSEMFQMKMVDLNDRPGRTTWKKNFLFHGGSDYWFGPSFYEIVPKEDLLRFTACDVNEVLEKDIVHIKLFELIDYWKDENQERLRQLRVLLCVDDQE